MTWVQKAAQIARTLLLHASKETAARVFTVLAFLALSPLVHGLTGKVLEGEVATGELVTINLNIFSSVGAPPPLPKEPPPSEATEEVIQDRGQTIATASLRVCRDDQGKELGKLRVVTFSTEYHWDLGSSSKVWLGGSEIKDFAREVLATDGLKSYLRADEIVAVGTASCEGNVERETCLAYDRAKALKGWVRTQRESTGRYQGVDDIHTLNLGRVKEECGGVLNKIFDTGSQRPLMLIGVTGEYSPEQLEYCLQKVLEEDGQGKTAKLLETYSEFAIDRPPPRPCPKRDR